MSIPTTSSPAQLYVNLGPDRSALLVQVRKTIGVSRPRYIEELLRRDMCMLDRQGVPSWWDRADLPEPFPTAIHAA